MAEVTAPAGEVKKGSWVGADFAFNYPVERREVSLTRSPLEASVLPYGAASPISDPCFRGLNTLKLTEEAEQTEPWLHTEITIINSFGPILEIMLFGKHLSSLGND